MRGWGRGKPGRGEKAASESNFGTLRGPNGSIIGGALSPSTLDLLQGGHAMATRFAGKVNAPDFPANLDWLNAERPLSLRDLRGKLVLLDFWTFC